MLSVYDIHSPIAIDKCSKLPNTFAHFPVLSLRYAHSTKRWATDIVQFCDFSLHNAIHTRTDTIAGSLLVLTLSEIVVIKAGKGAERRSKQLFGNDRSSSVNSAQTV